MTLRVLRAASASIASRLSFAGRRIRSAERPSTQVHSTPMLSRTSTSRLTSSIRAMPRSVVVPWFRSDPQSSATAAFLDERTSIDPLSRRPPWIRTCTAPLPAAMISLSRADAMRLIISSDRFWFPDSIR